ncbi:TPA: hypothetical protein VCA30_000998 [Bacillus cereus]|nr:hypothetical protein [Bacillus cereus]HDX9574508.1 hypothetical protein [Bacillus mobilis]MBL3861869.1 hypothetical protein [Bacillus cereus]HDR8084500.1 hypothetical protein [Bacillus cereus]HDR8246783.1 hypothetical protein [Bacillus cereus]
MSLLGFITLFVAFSYENKLIVASRINERILRPYASSLEEIIMSLNEYKLYTSKDFLLNFIYWIFLIVSSVSIISWGIIVGYYTNYSIDFSHGINDKNIVNLILFMIWGVLSFLLIAISILLNLIRFNKSPFSKGDLLDEKSLANIQCLLNKDGDLQELLFKIAPTIEILKIPPLNSEEYELNIFFPVKFSDLRFVLKIYREDRKKVILRIFGVLKDIERVGQSYSHILSSDLILGNLAITEQSVGELRFYDKENNLIGLAKLKVEKQQNNIKISTSRKMDVKMISNDNNFKDIENMNEEFIDFTYS